MTISRNLSILADGVDASGVLNASSGGTGLSSTPANGALDIGNGTGFTRTTLTAGSNISITNGSGSITIASTGGSSSLTISSKTAAYTVVAGDLGSIINCSGATSFTVSLTAAATLGSGFNCWIWNTTTTTAMVVTIDPNGAETIDGRTTLLLNQGEGMQIICDGTNWQTGDKKTMRGYAENYVATNTRPIATGSNSVAIGNSRASGSNSFAAAIASVAAYGATGSNSIAIGAQATASNTASVTIGGSGSTSSGFASLAIGYGANATAAGSVSIAHTSITGFNSAASETGSYAFGDSTVSAVSGQFSYASGAFGAAGDAQFGLYVLRAATTGSVVVLTTNGSGSGGTTNQAVVSSNQVMAVTGTLIGKQTGSANIAAYTITATVVNNAGTVTVPTGTLTLIGTDSIGLTTAPTLTADTTYAALKVTSGAKTATNIRWVCTLQTSQLVYA